MQKVIVTSGQIDSKTESMLNNIVNDGWRITNVTSQSVSVCSPNMAHFEYGPLMIVLEKIELVTMDSPPENVLKNMVEKFFSRLAKERKNG